MKKVILLKGLPASGKSTWAKEQIDKNPGKYKRVNKDDLRAMLDNGKWSKDNEKLVLNLRDNIILYSLQEGKHVIVDDTNLHPKHEAHIKKLVKTMAKVEVMEFDVDVDECVKRDLDRPNSVGEKVIRNMYEQFIKTKGKYEHKEGLPLAIICDIDGTLAHMSDRMPYEWHRVGEDSLNVPVAEVYSRFSDIKRLIFTGRDAVCQKETEEWLEKHGLIYDEFHMRYEGDNRKDCIVKEEMFDKIKDKYNILFVLDDRRQVVDMWREMGLTVLQVDDGNF